MKTLLKGLLLGLSLSLGLLTVAQADNSTHKDQAQAGSGHGNLMIMDAWSRVTAPSAKVGGGYLTLHNGGETDDRLLRVTAPHAGKTEIHTMIMQDDVMIMRPLDQALTIEAGGTVKLAPGGLHLMFMQLKEPQVEGQPLTAVLTFEHAGAVDVTFEVLSMRDSMERMEQAADHGEHGSAHHGEHSSAHHGKDHSAPSNSHSDH